MTPPTIPPPNLDAESKQLQIPFYHERLGLGMVALSFRQLKYMAAQLTMWEILAAENAEARARGDEPPHTLPEGWPEVNDGNVNGARSSAPSNIVVPGFRPPADLKRFTR